MLFKHGALVAGDHDFTLAVHTVPVMLDAAFFDLHPVRGDAVHAGAVGLGRGSLSVGDGDFPLELVPACVFTHVNTSSIVIARSRPGDFRGATWSERKRGQPEPLRSRLLTPFLVAPGAANEKSPERRFSPAKLSGLTVQAYSTC